MAEIRTLEQYAISRIEELEAEVEALEFKIKSIETGRKIEHTRLIAIETFFKEHLEFIESAEGRKRIRMGAIYEEYDEKEFGLLCDLLPPEEWKKTK